MSSYKQRHEAEMRTKDAAEMRRATAKEAMELATAAYEAKAVELNRLTRELDALRRAKDKTITNYQEVIAAYNRAKGLA